MDFFSLGCSIFFNLVLAMKLLKAVLGSPMVVKPDFFLDGLSQVAALLPRDSTRNKANHLKLPSLPRIKTPCRKCAVSVSFP